MKGRNSSVGIATRYGLDGPRIESRWGRYFSAHVQTDPGTHPVSYTLEVKRSGHDVNQPLHLVPKLKKEYSYASTPPLDLRSLLHDEMYFYL
jgi:hypothetical protein